MKAIILVGGEGTRLKPLTIGTPKPVVPVANRPFLDHVIARLGRSGVNGVILATGYLPDVIEGRLRHGGDHGVELAYSVEQAPLGTAGAVKLAEGHVDGTFAVLNGDTFSDLDLRGMVAFHRSRGAAATIALSWVADPSAFGVVEAGDDGRVRRFIEKPPPGHATSQWINAGVYVLEPEVLGLVPSDEPYMFERGLFPSLLERGDPVYGFRHPGYWLDMGTPGKYLQLNEDLLRGKAESPLVTPFADGEVRVEGAAEIHPTALVSGPALLGDGCRVGAGARIEGPAVLGAGCSVGAGAVIERAVLWNGATVGAGARVSRSVLGGGVTVGAGVRLADSAVVGHVGRVAVDG